MLIYLNGTSSSGKTSIATVLQQNMKKPALYFSIDTLLYALASDDLEAIMGKRPYRSPIAWDSIFSGYFSCVASLIKTGNSVIADCPVYEEKLASFYEQYLGQISKRANIKIYCPVEVIETRERNRKDRAVGIAKKQFPDIHKFLTYDFEVNSAQLSAEDSANEIYKHLVHSKLIT